MNWIAKTGRIIRIIFLITIALIGVPLGGIFMTPKRDDSFDNEVKIEKTEEKKEEKEIPHVRDLM